MTGRQGTRRPVTMLSRRRGRVRVVRAGMGKVRPQPHARVGLGSSLDQLCGNRRADPEALDAIDRATAQRPERRTHTTGNVSHKRETKPGNSSAQAL